MAVHDQVLATAQRISRLRRDGTFAVAEIVAALPRLNPGTVRTHVCSRCCVNAPAHHGSRWPYFERLGQGRYRLCEAYRPAQPATCAHGEGKVSETRFSGRETIHAVISESEGWYVAECLEVPVVTQGISLDDTLDNLREALGLYLEDEDPVPLGLVPSPRLSVSLDTTLAAT